MVGINSLKSFPDHLLHINICDVGQGDGIVIYTPLSHTILIDAGPDNRIQSCLTQTRSFFAKRIDLAIVSHFHADHITGFIDLLSANKFSTIIRNELNFQSSEKQEFEKKSLDNTKDLEEVWQSDQIEVEKDLTFQVLWPKKTSWNRQNGNWEAYLSDFNDSSVVLLMKYKSTATLFSGDAGANVLNEIADTLAQSNELKESTIHIYKVPHHGSQDAVSDRLIRLFNPQIAVISVGSNNTFGHPHKEAIASLENAHIPYLRTDQKGRIEITTDGSTLHIMTEK